MCNKFHYVKEISERDKAIISEKVDYEVLDKIDRISGKLDLSRNRFIIQCINYALDNLDEEDKKTSLFLVLLFT